MRDEALLDAARIRDNAVARGDRLHPAPRGGAGGAPRVGPRARADADRRRRHGPKPSRSSTRRAPKPTRPGCTRSPPRPVRACRPGAAARPVRHRVSTTSSAPSRARPPAAVRRSAHPTAPEDPGATLPEAPPPLPPELTAESGRPGSAEAPLCCWRSRSPRDGVDHPARRLRDRQPPARRRRVVARRDGARSRAGRDEARRRDPEVTSRAARPDRRRRRDRDRADRLAPHLVVAGRPLGTRASPRPRAHDPVRSRPGRDASARASAGTPVVSTLANDAYGPDHRAEYPHRRRQLREAQIVDAASARLTTRLHAVSWQIAETMSHRLAYPRKRIYVIPRGRDPEQLGRRSPERRDRARAMLGIGREVPVVLAVSRQERQKSLGLLIDALPRIVGAFPDARVLVAGQPGNDTDALEAKLALSPHAELLHAPGRARRRGRPAVRRRRVRAAESPGRAPRFAARGHGPRVPGRDQRHPPEPRGRRRVDGDLHPDRRRRRDSVAPSSTRSPILRGTRPITRRVRPLHRASSPSTAW